LRWISAAIGLLPLAAIAMVGHAQSAPELPRPDALRLAEAIRLAEGLRDDLWPGWGRTAMPVLLVRDSAEFLIGHSRPTADFAPLGYDSLLQREVWTRPRQFSSNLLATFPAVGGVPTIVIGSAERTGKSSVAWVLTLLHEHFHQWQYSQPNYYSGVAKLDLAGGDSTGQWMLEYPFPYDSAPVQRAVRVWATALARALASRSSTRAHNQSAVVAERDALRRSLAASDDRYLEFQLWQEGVARFIEYATAKAAARYGKPSAEFRALPDYESYSAAAVRMRRSLRRELEQLALEQQRRASFYPLGAAMALLLDRSGSDWKRAYTQQPFTLSPLLSALQ
jgi:hypothetical protein